LAVEGLAFDWAVVADFDEGVYESGEVYDSGGCGEASAAVDLLVDFDVGGCVVYVDVDDVCIGELEEFVYGSVGGVPVPAIEEEADVGAVDGADKFDHVFLCTGKGESESCSRGAGAYEFESEADAVVVEDFGDFGEAAAVAVEVFHVCEFVVAGDDPGGDAVDAELFHEGGLGG